MIFVTVGHSRDGFLRLLDAVETCARSGAFGGEKIVVQSGHNAGFRGPSCTVVPFLPADEFQRWLAAADVVVSHGGSTLLSAIRLGKLPVAMPRRKKYKEIVNDHQLEFVRALAADGWVVPVYEPADLPRAVDEARTRAAQSRPFPKSGMLDLVRAAIGQFA